MTSFLPTEDGEFNGNAASRCICQDEHRRGYCTESDCPYAVERKWCNEPLPTAQELIDKAMEEGRGTYLLGLARTLNPYMSVQLRNAWFEGYDG